MMDAELECTVMIESCDAAGACAAADGLNVGLRTDGSDCAAGWQSCAMLAGKRGTLALTGGWLSLLSTVTAICRGSTPANTVRAI